MQSLLEMSRSERPRERLLSEGASRLEDEQLLALVLGTGRGSGEDALQLAARVLVEAGGLSGLADAEPERLMRITGIGPVKATRIVAALELAARVRGRAERGARGARAAAEPPDPLARLVQRLRGEVPAGERAVLGFRGVDDEAPVTLALGEGIGPQTRPGAVLARLLTAGQGPWWVVVVRPGGPPTGRERDAADRLFVSADLVGLRLERVLVVAGRRHWALEAEGAP